MDTKQNHLPYSRGREQSRAAPVGHQIPVYHKCSNYCRRRKRVKGTYITYCRFGFPRPTCESGTLLCIDSDLLLGDHLCGQSKTIKWVDVFQPHNQNRRLINHSRQVE